MIPKEALAAVLVALAVVVMPARGQSAGPALPGGFGASVAVGGERVFVAEAATVAWPGRVFVYEASPEGGWVEVARLVAPDSWPGDGFGTALDAGMDVLLVGQDAGAAGTVHVFAPRRDGWRRTDELRPEAVPARGRYGAAVALGSGVVAVGAPGTGEEAGRVYLFRRKPGGWEEAGWVEGDPPRAGDRFGTAIDMDGTRMLVGAPGHGGGAGAALIFRLDPATGEWSRETRLEGADLETGSRLGTRVVLGPAIALASAPGHDGGRGAVLEFGLDPVDGLWSSRTRLVGFDAGPGSGFGTAMAAGPGGAYVGAPGAGAAGAIYGLRRRDGRWTGSDRIEAERVSPGGKLGTALAMGSSVAVASAAGEDFGAGAALIMTWSGSDWRPADMVKSSPESLPVLVGSEVPCDAGRAHGFACRAVDLLSFLPVAALGGGRGARVTDVVGWTDPATGREYAVVARLDGTAFIDVTDPILPRKVAELPPTRGAPAADRRRIGLYRNHVLVVAGGEGRHGMQVFDLTRLRAAPEGFTFDADAVHDELASARELVIDTTAGIAYAVGAPLEGCDGAHAIDVRAPKAPRDAGCVAVPAALTGSAGSTGVAPGTASLSQRVVHDTALPYRFRIRDPRGGEETEPVGYFETLPDRGVRSAISAGGRPPEPTGAGALNSDGRLKSGVILLTSSEEGLFLLRADASDFQAR